MLNIKPLSAPHFTVYKVPTDSFSHSVSAELGGQRWGKFCLVDTQEMWGTDLPMVPQRGSLPLGKLKFGKHSQHSAQCPQLIHENSEVQRGEVTWPRAPSGHRHFCASWKHASPFTGTGLDRRLDLSPIHLAGGSRVLSVQENCCILKYRFCYYSESAGSEAEGCPQLSGSCPWVSRVGEQCPEAESLPRKVGVGGCGLWTGWLAWNRQLCRPGFC